ncbi:hypothetical protein DRP07_06520, partial [Archaeoglobales archaeon]
MVYVRGKGFVSMMELIIVALILFAAFNIFFPGFSYRSRWSDALLLLKGRDIVLTIDRLEKLYNYSFDRSSLNEFLAKAFPETSLIVWPEIKGAIKSDIKVSCNCTDEELDYLRSWLSGIKLNGRDITFTICPTDLERINPCGKDKGPDVLVIIGYKELTDPKYLSLLREHLKKDNGIVEVADLTEEQIDDVQKEIFGLNWTGGFPNELIAYDEFGRKPDGVDDIIFHPYKYFHHVPIMLQAFPSRNVKIDPVLESTPPVCSDIARGVFKLRVNTTTDMPENYTFWICDFSSVYFDTDANQSADIVILVNDDFSVNYSDMIFNFSLRYVEPRRIGVSFKPGYTFHDFIKVDYGSGSLPPGREGKGLPPGEPSPPGWQQAAWASYEFLYPIDRDVNRILIRGNQDVRWENQDHPTPAVILNATFSRAAWIANFTENGVGDDERLLFISLLLWASNKKSEATVPENLR